MKRAALAVLFVATSVSAQHVDFVPAGYCSGDVCFIAADGCADYRASLEDEARHSPACRAVRSTWSFEYYSTLDRDRFLRSAPTRAACEHARRELQLSNRGHRHFYEEIEECEEYHYTPPADDDHDGVPNTSDLCADQAEDGRGDLTLSRDGCVYSRFCFTDGSFQHRTCVRTFDECDVLREQQATRERSRGTWPTSCAGDEPDAGVDAGVDGGLDSGVAE